MAHTIMTPDFNTMTADQLQTLEAELQKRGYKKYTSALTSTESYAWFKKFDKVEDEDGDLTSGYQAAFRVWDFRRYADRNFPSYGLDFWASPLGIDSRIDLSVTYEPIANIDTFERMAAEFHQLTRKYTDKTDEKDNVQ